MVANRQKGQIAVRQLRWLGLGRGAIQHRIGCGRLHCVDRGVYAVGYVPDLPAARWMTAVLRLGPEAVLSHQTAAVNWNVRANASPLIHITYPRRHRNLPHVHFHTASLPPDEIAVHDDLPTTTVPRTLFDLAAVLPAPDLEEAIAVADELRLTDPLSLPDLIDRYPRRRGVATLKRVLGHGAPARGRTHRGLEKRFRLLLRRAGLPLPRTNVFIDAGGERYECDCVWEQPRLIVELDGRRHHSGWTRQESDRRRDRLLTGAGWTVIRISWSQLNTEADEILAQLRSLIYTQPPRRRSSVGRALHS